MYGIKKTAAYKRDLKTLRKRGYDMDLINSVITTLAAGKQLEPKHRDHALIGDYVGFRECHITPDWLLIYKIKADVLVLVLQRTGTHSDLF